MSILNRLIHFKMFIVFVACLFSLFQVFSAITKLVLQQKKENGVKTGGEKSTIKLQKATKDHKKCSC